MVEALQQVEAAILNGAYGRIWMLRLTGVGVIGFGSTGISGYSIYPQSRAVCRPRIAGPRVRNSPI